MSDNLMSMKIENDTYQIREDGPDLELWYEDGSRLVSGVMLDEDGPEEMLEGMKDLLAEAWSDHNARS
jgi:hypothetical protein